MRCFFVFGGNMEVCDNKQTLVLEDRKKLVIDGIINVECFNDDYLELESNSGRIEIEGSSLKIQELRQDTGKILITGDISGVFYRDNKMQRKHFGKIFK